jgi:hypothetical protein
VKDELVGPMTGLATGTYESLSESQGRRMQMTRIGMKRKVFTTLW